MIGASMIIVPTRSWVGTSVPVTGLAAMTREKLGPAAVAPRSTARRLSESPRTLTMKETLSSGVTWSAARRNCVWSSPESRRMSVDV
jgi:hypothetical protein